MKKNYMLGCFAALAAFNMSCSAALQRRYDQRHGVSTSTTEPSSRSTNSRERETGPETYRKDYDRIADNTGVRDADALPVETGPDYNHKLLQQYAEMDKLGEVVLYELDILETKYNAILADYRTAKPSARQGMTMDLDKLSDDQLVLYKAYTNIYRNGKSNWPVVKREVENTLRSVRKVTEK
jgi:hypothetical protein